MTERSESNRETPEILVVEDNAMQAELLRHMLARRGYAVRVAGDGVRALEMVRQRRPTLVLSDIAMPEMDGYQMCEAIKSDGELADIPVVLLTSLTDPEDVILGLGARADNYVTKPYDEELLVALERLETQIPDLILLDLMMPEMDGFELVEAMRMNEDWRPIPVIVVTAEELTAEDRQRLDDGVAMILEKSAHGPEELLAQIRERMDSA